MKRWMGPALLAAVATFAVGVGVVLLKPAELPSGVIDPAAEFYSTRHEVAYGGIDRWAYWGMRADRTIDLLRQAGYSCGESSARRFGSGAFGRGKVACSRQVQWPLRRTLKVELDIDHDRHDRLVAAKAGCTLVGGPEESVGIAGFLRRMGWIEPDALPIRGFERDSAQTLARQAVDALRTGGWQRACEAATPQDCGADAQRRRATGFPPLPTEPVAVGNAKSLSSAMERIALWPAQSRGPDGSPEDSLLLRVENGQLWADFVGGDLTGQQVAIAIELDSEGGRPIQLVAQVGEERLSVALAGAPLRANDERMSYLMPEAGSGPYRIASWVYPPGQEASPSAIARFARDIAEADRAFAPKLVQVLVARLTTAARPDERLGLYPALSRIDRLADSLREAGVVRVVDQAATSDDPVVRSAWALARCESGGRPPILDSACWRAYVANDTDVLELLRKEVTRLDKTYVSLDASHPVRQRLSRLRDALAIAPSQP